MLRTPKALLLFPLLVACGSSQPPPAQPAPDATTTSAPASSAASPVAATDAGATPTSTTAAAADPADAAAFAASIEAFNADLYAKLKSGKGNVFYSPTSIEVALAMAAAGAHGDTAQQMQKVLHLGSDAGKTNAAASHLLASWTTPSDSGPTLNVANRLWGQKDYAFLPDYLQTTHDSYGAELALVDFKKAPEDARKAINTWVADKTNQKILDLIPSGALSPLTRLVLTNAVYFKGTWSTAFDKASTKNESFLAGTTKVTVPMMQHKFTSAMYAELPHAQMLSLPYKGDAAHSLSMVIVLPKSGTPLTTAEADLNSGAVTKWVGMETMRSVNVSLPRFKTSSQFELGPTLKQMGMPLPFSDQADFTGMSSAKGGEELKISNVIHKAFVDVNEDGTEAAAATGVVMGTRGMMVPQNPVDFKVDHPFAFFIRDDKSGAILFAGKIENPTK
ncbi:MAG: serpin family protein [Polyangiaceae bacterium]